MFLSSSSVFSVFSLPSHLGQRIANETLERVGRSSEERKKEERKREDDNDGRLNLNLEQPARGKVLQIAIIK